MLRHERSSSVYCAYLIKGSENVSRHILVWALGLVVALGGVTRALAQQPTEREKELLKKIEALEKRVGELEKKGTPAKPAEGAAEKKAEGEALRAYWKDGLRFDNTDGSVKLQIGALIQDDWASIAEDGPKTAGTRGGTEFRRARVSIAGTVHDKVEFKAEYDFAGGATRLVDVYAGLLGVPYVGTIRAGHFKEPLSLEWLTADASCTFMERSLPNALVPDRNVGLMLTNTCMKDRLTWAAGVFHNADEFGKGLGQNADFTGRVTGLPCYKGDNQFVHVGFGLSFRNPADDTLRYSSRPEAHLAPNLVDTGAVAADSVTLLGGEIAAVYKRASLQGEYVASKVNPVAAGPDLDFSGYYVTGSYFLTGESRPYRKTTGVFDRVRPKHNFMDGKGGLGAWEVAARYSALDLSDGAILGGKLTDWTLGVNWYLNPTARVSLNYVMADTSANPDERIVEMRTQISF